MLENLFFLRDRMDIVSGVFKAFSGDDYCGLHHFLDSGDGLTQFGRKVISYLDAEMLLEQVWSRKWCGCKNS